MRSLAAQDATSWVARELAGMGWPPADHDFLARLATHIGPEEVEHVDCGVVDHGDPEDAGTLSTATVAVFTASHLLLQEVDLLGSRPWRFRSHVRVVRRSSLRSLTSADEDVLATHPLADLCDWCWHHLPVLAGAVERCVAWVASWSPTAWRWYYEERADGSVQALLRYGDLDAPLLLPLEDDTARAERLARFLPRLTADLR